MRRLAPALLWTLGYVLLASLPLLALRAAPGRSGLGFAWDLALALGFAGLAVMVLQSVLTARFRRAGAPFGTDILYYFHRWMAVAGLALLVAHWVVLRVSAPAALTPSLPGDAPAYMTAGRAALLLFATLVASSLWRKPLRIEYDRWRRLHATIAVAAVGLALGHVAGAGAYTRAPAPRAVWAVYAVGWLCLVAYVRLLRPWRVRAHPWRVASVRPERGRSWTLTLEPEGHAGLRFRPGQFAWLTLRASPFAAREHPFSFSGSAEAAPTLEFTIRELGDFTRTMAQIRPGEIAYVDGPHGSFTPYRHPDAAGFGFVAGGVGIAPVMSMLRTLADRGERRPLGLAYANDRWDDVLFREEIEALRQRLDLRVEHVLLEPPPDWDGATGYVSREVLRRVLPGSGSDFVYFLCGPEPMTEAAQRALRELGVPLGRIHFERFDMV